MVESEKEKALAKALSEQKKLVAGDLFGEAWNGGIAAGIEPEILAETLARRAIEALARTNGDAAAGRLAELIERLNAQGQLFRRLTLQ